MKKIYSFMMSMLGAAFLYAQTPVTFTVDIAGAGLTPDANGIHIAGNFGDPNYDGSIVNGDYVNWSPSAIELLDNGDGTYSLTLNLLPEHYEFKFINGNDWPMVEDVPNICQVELNGNDNRYIEVGSDAVEYAVCFASCALCNVNAVLLRVDMSLIDEDGDGITGEIGDDISSAGVYVAGGFDANGTTGYPAWNPSGIQCAPMGNGVYGVVLNLNAGNYEYKFVNGNAWGFDETVSGACANNGNRTLSVTGPNQLTDASCFGSCSTCLMPTNVTFRVNMSNETVSPNGVHLAGSLQGWDPGAADWALTDVGNSVYEITKAVQPGSYEFKFINGNAWSGADNDNESVPAECNTNGNRAVTVAGTSMLVEYCYNQCTAECVVDPNPADITFRVNMANLITAGTFDAVADTIWMISGATSPVWQDGRTIMTDANGDQVYECTLNLSGPAAIQYKFIGGQDIFAPTVEEGPGINTICGINNGIGGYNRTHVRAGVNEVLPVVCFDLCGDCAGCGDSTACNYNAFATTIDNLLCAMPNDSCDDGLSNTFNDVYNDSCVCAGTVSIQEWMLADQVSVYPNPTDGLLNIAFQTINAQKLNVRVYNVMGQLVMTEQYNKVAAGKNNLTLDLTELKTGIYMVEVLGNNTQNTIRVSVK